MFYFIREPMQIVLIQSFGYGRGWEDWEHIETSSSWRIKPFPGRLAAVNLQKLRTQTKDNFRYVTVHPTSIFQGFWDFSLLFLSCLIDLRVSVDNPGLFAIRCVLSSV